MTDLPPLRQRSQHGYDSGHAFDRRLWLWIIVAIIAVTFLIAVYSLAQGVTGIYPYLFFLPLVLIAYFYPEKGVLASLLLGSAFILLNWLFLPGNLVNLSASLLIASVFIGIGGLVSILSDNIASLSHRYQHIFDMSEAGILIADRGTGLIRESNPGVYALLGYSEEDLFECPLSKIWKDTEEYRAFISGIEHTGRLTNQKIQLITRDGRPRHFLISGRFLDTTNYLFSLVDIQSQVEIQAELSRSLNEKEVLLKEVHHRVKNNMQVISSFLELAALQAESEQDQAQFRETQGRVRTMALVHEKLYQSEWEEKVNAREFFQDLVAEILSSSGIRPILQVEIEVSEIILDIDQAIPCGLIINELLTNSLKYAFAGRDRGFIRISLDQDEGGNCTFGFGDDGAGLPDGFSWETSRGMGLRLVRFLSQQLDGSLSVETGGGTRYTIVFPFHAQ
jgi:PAS domain S-box-containing protein